MKLPVHEHADLSVTLQSFTTSPQPLSKADQQNRETALGQGPHSSRLTLNLMPRVDVHIQQFGTIRPRGPRFKGSDAVLQLQE